MGLVDGVWMLDNLIKRDLAPKNVIMVLVYDSWNRNIHPALYGQYPFKWVYGDAVKPKIILPKQYRKEIFYSHFLPIYHQAERVRTIIKKPAGFKKDLPYIDEKGYNPYPWGFNEREIIADAQWHREFTIDRKPYISPHNILAINYLHEIAKKTDINIYIANSPVYDDLMADSTFNSFYTELAMIISNELSGYQNIHYINNPPLLFEMKYLQSADHLTDEGATIFTNHLLKEITGTRAR
ncbi:MAG: hypothetical protein K9H49_18805 [Bacteroidales bacterium]|nr:hypothetical protein [Bacteroidales bacterium]